MKDMKLGEKAFLYHSNCRVPGIAGKVLFVIAINCRNNGDLQGSIPRLYEKVYVILSNLRHRSRSISSLLRRKDRKQGGTDLVYGRRQIPPQINTDHSPEGVTRIQRGGIKGHGGRRKGETERAARTSKRMGFYPRVRRKDVN